MGFITATMFLNFAGLTIIIPVIPYITERYTTHIALFVGLLTSTAAFCQFLATPALGYLSDMYGRRPVILWSLLGGVIGYLVFGIGGSLGMLFVGRIIDGLSGGDTTAMYAYVADVFPSKDRAKYYGMLGAAAALGFMAGPVIGGLAARISLTAPLFVAAGISLLNICWGYVALPESLKPEHRVATFHIRDLNPLVHFRLVFSSSPLRVLLLITGVFFTGLIMQQSNFSVFLKDMLHWGPTNIGIVLTLVGLVDFVAEGYLTGKLTPMLGEMKLLHMGIVLTMGGMLLVGTVAFTTSAMTLYAAIILYSLGDGLFEPAMTTLIANATDPPMQGRVQGANQSIQSIARVLAPLMAGLCYEVRAYMPYFMSALLMAVLLVLLRFSTSSLPVARRRAPVNAPHVEASP
ncbi:MAG TPA: MFS transporter [Gemmatimonadaceae bacterium]|nr:MFS transporter [Gemmatimonadaceae bacterium]